MTAIRAHSLAIVVLVLPLVVSVGAQSATAQTTEPFLVKNINPGGGAHAFQVSTAGNNVMTGINGTLFFAANDGTNGWELWKSDGTAAGTVMVKNINPGGGASAFQVSTAGNNVMTGVDGTLFFAANDGDDGFELWAHCAGPVPITQQPTDQSVCAGQQATFTVSVSVMGAAYQWQVSTNGGATWNNIPGAVAPSYTTAPAGTADNGKRFRCVVSALACSATSAAATLNVNSATVISAHPAAQTECPGETATFCVAATGTGLTYQWQVSTNAGVTWNNVSGATGTCYTTPPVGTGDNGKRFRCVVSGACGAATSNAAMLSVVSGGDCNGNGVVDVCDIASGTSSDANGNGVPDECERIIVSANPPAASPYVSGQPFRDVLQNTDAALTAQGIGVIGTPSEGAYMYATVSVTFSGAPSPAPAPGNITVTCTGGACPTVTAVSGAGAGPYLLTLSGGIPVLHCTTLTFAGTSAGQKLQYQDLPGDVNLNDGTSGQDVLTLVGAINDASSGLPANLARLDINRNGGVTGQDVLRLVQLINGASSTQSFNGATVASCP